MIAYNDVYNAFETHLGPVMQELEYVGSGTTFLAHPALAQLLQMLEVSNVDNRSDMIRSLVSDMIRNGDEKIQELVDVSFFENMDHISPECIRSISLGFDQDVRERMENALRRFGVCW